MARAARVRVSRVTELLSGSRSLSSWLRLVSIRRAISAFVRCCFFIASSIYQARTRLIARRGDIVWLSFTPQAGHEQAGRRPALVLSPSAYNRKVGLGPAGMFSTGKISRSEEHTS